MIRNIVIILIGSLLVMGCKSSQTTAVSTTSAATNIEHLVYVDTLRLYDSTHVEDYKTDSIHYIMRDHYNIGTRTINTHSTDTIVKVDSVYVESETNTGITRKEYYQLLCWVILLIALLVYAVYWLKDPLRLPQGGGKG